MFQRMPHQKKDGSRSQTLHESAATGRDLWWDNLNMFCQQILFGVTCGAGVILVASRLPPRPNSSQRVQILPDLVARGVGMLASCHRTTTEWWAKQTTSSQRTTKVAKPVYLQGLAHPGSPNHCISKVWSAWIAFFCIRLMEKYVFWSCGSATIAGNYG